MLAEIFQAVGLGGGLASFAEIVVLILAGKAFYEFVEKKR